jgi:Sulfotransferase domain
MAAPIFHLIIPGLPKSANVFIESAMQATLGCAFVRFANMQQEILPEKLDGFFALPRAVGGQHFLPTAHNLAQLGAHDVRRICILVRDPRDAVISAWRHFERADIKANPKTIPIIAATGAISLNYYDLSPEQKLRDLVDHLFPVFQNWVATWLDVVETSTVLQCRINRYEDFAADQRGALRAMLEFFGHDVEPVLPAIGETREAGIDTATHFRRGKVGSYRDEAPPDLVRLFDERLDRGLAARMGWA